MKSIKIERSTFGILLFFIFSLSTFSQSNQAPHPLYVANILVDDISVERMMQTCRFHHLSEAPSEDGYTVFTDTKGNKLRFKKTDNPESGVNGKLIELQTRDNTKTLEKILKETGYKKQNKAYERGSHLTQYHTRCILVSKGGIKFLSFLRIKNN